MVTPGCCCCWYLAKATEKNGASNVDPAPVMVGLWPGGPVLAATAADAGVPVELVLVQAARVSRMIAAADQMTGWMVRRG
jgi:hypothetical protein